MGFVHFERKCRPLYTSSLQWICCFWLKAQEKIKKKERTDLLIYCNDFAVCVKLGQILYTWEALSLLDPIAKNKNEWIP